MLEYLKNPIPCCDSSIETLYVTMRDNTLCDNMRQRVTI